jgi:glycosyltransferase involved in cell wall biosynthesis
MARTSIVISTWNLLEPYHRRCIIRAREEIGEGEIIVMDNGSKDGTPFYLREALKCGLIDKLKLFEENKGVSRSRNYGVTLAQYSRVMLLDGDILIPRGWIALANQYLDENPQHRAISIYPALCTADSNNYTDKLDKLREVHESQTSCTNVGIYRKPFLQEIPFPEVAEYQEAGWGFEDTIMSAVAYAKGIRWAHVYDEKIKYLHPLNSSRKLLIRQLGEQEANRRQTRRRNMFEKSVAILKSPQIAAMPANKIYQLCAQG